MLIMSYQLNHIMSTQCSYKADVFRQCHLAMFCGPRIAFSSCSFGEASVMVVNLNILWLTIIPHDTIRIQTCDMIMASKSAMLSHQRLIYWYCNLSHSLIVYKGYLLGIVTVTLGHRSNISSMKEYHQHDMVYFHILRGAHPDSEGNK